MSVRSQYLTGWIVATPERQILRAAFGTRLKESEPLARHTAARLGGPADYLVEAANADELAEAVRTGWQAGLPVSVLGGGSNLLISDAGVRGLVVLNRARGLTFRAIGDQVLARAESGLNLGALARQCVARGLGGFEWAVGIPGTLGGAVFGNAGAHGGDLAGNFRLAEILQRDGVIRPWEAAALDFGYRTSALKRQRPAERGVVLAAELVFQRADPLELQARVETFTAQRKRSQPPGASLGSMFKNPPGDYAGRLIEAAGLKGRRVGQAEISPQHANFFINQGEARAADVLALIHLAHNAVREKFGVDLELEVELLGEWGGQC